MSLDSITRYVATIKMYGLKTVLGVGNAEIRGGIPCLKGIKVCIKRGYK